MNRTPEATAVNDPSVHHCATGATEVVAPNIAAAAIRNGAPRSPLPNYLIAGLTTSSATHVGAAVLASVLLNGYMLRVAPPRQGLSSMASAPSALVLEATWSDDQRQQQSDPEPIAMAATRRETVVEARPTPVVRHGKLPTAEGAERQAFAPLVAQTSVRAQLPNRNQTDEPHPPRESPR